MLLLLAHCVSLNILPKGIRVISTLLELEETMKASDMLMLAIMCRLDPSLDLMVQAMDQICDAVGDTRNTTDHLYRTFKEIRDDLQCDIEAVKEEIQKVVDSIKDETGKLAEVAAMAVKNTGRGVPASQNLELTAPHIATHMDVLNSCLPTAYLSTLAKI